MQITPEMLLIVCPLALLAGFVDSIAGGGGLISLPAYYLAGLTPPLAAGTNKLAAAMGTALATRNYHKADRILWPIAIPAALGALVCSALGALVLTQLPESWVRWLVIGCIPIAAVFTLRGTKEKGQRPARNWSDKQRVLLSALVGCAIGFYDGLVGPGTGTFLILLFMQLFGTDPVKASGTAKVVNLASNVAALGYLLCTRDVMILLGLPAGVCAMVGAFLGSKLTIHKGGGVVRWMMLLVLGLLLAKMCLDMVR